MRVMRCFWPSRIERTARGRTADPQALADRPCLGVAAGLLQLEQKRQLAHRKKLVFHERLDGFLKLLNGHFETDSTAKGRKYNAGREQFYCYFLSICCVTDPPWLATGQQVSKGMTENYGTRTGAAIPSMERTRGRVDPPSSRCVSSSDLSMLRPFGSMILRTSTDWLISSRAA